MSFLVPFLFEDELGEPLLPATVDSLDEVPGPHDLGTFMPAMVPATVDSPDEVPGPVAPLDPVLAQPITPRSIDTPEQVPGPWFPIPAPPLDPGIPAGPATVSRAMVVVGYPHRTAAQCTPKLNDPGTGGFTTPKPAPVLDELVGYNVAGRRVFTGKVTKTTDTLRATGEETAQLVQAQTDGLLTEFDYARVLPDFGAQDLDRLGPPTQDTRFFDWTMNGLGTDDPDGVPEPKLIRSAGIVGNYGTPLERFPMPDVWPDPYAKWMWVADPGRTHQPVGWCFFRERFGIPGSNRIQLWMCAYDYAEMYLDGVLVLTCDKPGVAQHLELDVRDDFHLLAIRAHNGGGKAGVLASVVPVNRTFGLYEEPLRRSSGGWLCLAYPTRTFRLNPAQVLRRLQLEARRRNVAFIPLWRFTFNETHDSAGRPWPAVDPIAIQVGSSYSDVLRQLSTDLIDYAAAPAGRVLHAWVKDEGTGRDLASPWTDGVDVVGKVRTRSTR